MYGRSGPTSRHALKRRIERISGVEPAKRPRHPCRVKTRLRVLLDLQGATGWRPSIALLFAERLGQPSQFSGSFVHGYGNGKGGRDRHRQKITRRSLLTGLNLGSGESAEGRTSCLGAASKLVRELARERSTPTPDTATNPSKGELPNVYTHL